VITACIAGSSVLGVVGWYSVIPTTVLLAVIGGVMWYVARRLRPRQSQRSEAPPERLGRPGNVLAVVAVSFVAAMWGSRAYVALSHGMISIDSLWYHLPLAARFAHEHSITGIHHDVPDLSGFYAINSELLHSLGMVLLGNDFLSTVLTLLLGAVALVAAWCIGRPYGMGAPCAMGVSVLLCAPAFVASQPGAAHNDIVGVTLLLATAALLIQANAKKLTRDPVVLALAAMSVGLIVGTKWTFVPLAVAMTVGVIVLIPRGARLRLSAMWLAIVGTLGCFSYVRNLVRAGSPLPNVDLTIGPLGWERKAPEISGMASVTEFLFDGEAWEDFLLPGLSIWFGYAWWAVVALVVLGVVLAVVSGPGSVVRMLGAVGAVSLIAYLVQPQLLTMFNQPVYFASNIRYASTAIALGLVLLPVSRLLTRRGIKWLTPLAFLAVIVVMQFDSAVWPIELRDLRAEAPVRGADAVAGLVAGLVTLAIGLGAVFWEGRSRFRPAWQKRAGSRGRLALVGVALGVLLVLLVGSQRWYLAHRYARPDAPTPFLFEHWRSWEWARGTANERIGYKPPVLPYPFYGNRLSNTVEALSGYQDRSRAQDRRERVRAGQPAGRPVECPEFRREINERGFTHVVIFGSLAPTRDLPEGVPTVSQSNPEVGWLDAEPSATRVVDEPLEVVFRIDGELDPESCPSSP
jgi:hypothetical protein